MRGGWKRWAEGNCSSVEITESENRCPLSHCLSFFCSLFAFRPQPLAVSVPPCSVPRALSPMLALDFCVRSEQSFSSSPSPAPRAEESFFFG